MKDFNKDKKKKKRAEDCSGMFIVILRSVVQIRLAGYLFVPS